MEVRKIAKCGLYVLLILAGQIYAAEDKPYSITEGKVDEITFQGWWICQEVNCGLCHGDSGQGGPSNLVERLKTISKAQFVDSVTRGKGLMPPFKLTKRSLTISIKSMPISRLAQMAH